MSSAFTVGRPSRVRAIGLAIALLLHVGLLGVLRFRIGVEGSATAATTLFVACLFSWLLADRAVRPGWRPALSATMAFATGAVVCGSFMVAGLASIAAGSEADVIIGSTIELGLLGLVFLGIPMLVFGLVLSALWVFGVRVVVRL